MHEEALILCEEWRAMRAALHCDLCGAELSPDSQCPRCLLGLGLRTLPEDADSPTASVAVISSHVGQSYGPYRTLRVLGEGGMGIVYLAEQQEPIQRRVAVKVIKLGMDSKEVIARFESERQALALMDHRNIARVLDAGTSQSGRPYFVMEYVPGIPITDYCDQHQLSSRDRLKLFQQVCQAIQHAHQKGVIHRDIKPSNILVEERDGQPVPKVIDFGVAKATEQALTKKTLFTQIGALIGTPAYMSPEQAGLTESAVDTTTDIYSLGVVLYELLVGAPPFDPTDLRRAGYAEIFRVIREVEPPKPTTKLESLGTRGMEVAKRRHTDVRTLLRQLQGDLEWITMKALEKDRLRRYESASELAADIGRHLNDEPVMASPPSVTYRARKFLRKHRTGVTAAAALLLVSLAGAAVSSIQFLHAQRQKHEAQWQSYVANIAAADAHMRAGELSAAQQQLLKCEPSLRGWEWRYLWARSDTSMATLYAAGDIHSIGFSRNGKQILLASSNHVEVRDASTFTLITTYRSFPSVLALSPDGTRILTAGSKDSQPLELMDPASRGVVVKLPGPLERPRSVAFSMDSKLVAAGFRDGRIWIWNAASGNRLAIVSGNKKPVTALTFSKDGTLIAAGAEDGGMRVWDSRSGHVLAVASGKGSISDAAFSPNGRQLAWGTAKSLQVWEWPSGHRTLDLSLESHDGVSNVIFDPDNNRMVVRTGDGLVQICDARSGKQLELLSEANSDPFTAGIRGSGVVALNPENNTIWASTARHDVRVWDSNTQAAVLNGVEKNSLEQGEESLSLTHVALVANRRLYLWQLGVNRPLPEWNGKSGYENPLFSPDGTLLAAVSDRNRVTVWNVATTAPVALLAVQNTVVSLAFCGDGSRIATLSDDQTARVWEVKSGRFLRAISVPAGSDVALDSRGTRMLITIPSWSGPSMRLFDVDTGQLSVAADVPRTPRPRTGFVSQEGLFVSGDFGIFIPTIQFSPDDRWIANGEIARVGVWLRDSSTASLVSTLMASDPVWKLRFTPDSARLATAGPGESITIWDPSRSQALLLLRECSPFFAIGSDRLVCLSGSDESSVHVRVWDTRSNYYPGARERVEALLRQHFLVGEVVSSLEGDNTADEAFRKAAIAEAKRHQDDLLGLIEWANSILADPHAGRKHYQLVQDRLNAVAPDLDPWSRSLLGIAQYRLGRYTEALATLLRENDDNVESLAFLAMTYQRLGNHLEATGQLARLSNKIPKRQPAGSILGRLLDESETVIERSPPTGNRL